MEIDLVLFLWIISFPENTVEILKALNYQNTLSGLCSRGNNALISASLFIRYRYMHEPQCVCFEGDHDA